MQTVSVIKCKNYEINKVYTTIKESLKNINFKIPKNKTILLKPNVLGPHPPEKAITTHPIILEAVCKLLKENNCKIWIGDSCGIADYGFTNKCFKVCKIEAVAKKYNAKLIAFETETATTIKDDKAKILKKINIAQAPLKADLIINLPKLKTHVLMKYTGAVKNMFGCIPGGLKSKLHSKAPREDLMGKLLLDIYQNVKPELTIMDGIVGLEGNGPGVAGIPKKIGLILASKDAVALDIIATKIIGYNPMDIATIKFAIERGLLKNLNDIEVIGEKNVSIKYKKPDRLSKLISKAPPWLTQIFFILSSKRPYVDKDKCKRCRVCFKVCPVKAISMKPFPTFNRTKCILCYCCHENCPYDAIILKRNRFMEFLQKFKQKIMGNS